MQTIRYGPAESQEADLYLSEGKRSPVVCLLHGGFWRLPHGREPFDPVARDLVSRGFAVWNIEYRRLGAPAGISRSGPPPAATRRASFAVPPAFSPWPLPGWRRSPTSPAPT